MNDYNHPSLFYLKYIVTCPAKIFHFPASLAVKREYGLNLCLVRCKQYLVVLPGSAL